MTLRIYEVPTSRTQVSNNAVAFIDAGVGIDPVGQLGGTASRLERIQHDLRCLFLGIGRSGDRGLDGVEKGGHEISGLNDV